MSSKDNKRRIVLNERSVRFDGDVVITDPCYIRHGLPSERIEDDFWAELSGQIPLENGVFATSDVMSLERRGVDTYIVGNTIYGDWGCTAFETGTDKVLGNFCADSGTFGVFLMSEILAFNPGFQEWLDAHDWCAAVISDFHGVVKAVHTKDEPVDKEHDIPFLTHAVHLEGTGSKGDSPGELFEFYTEQTGI